MQTLNKWVLRNEVNGNPVKDGSRVIYTGLCLADTLEDAEYWMDELGLEGTLMTREDYEKDTPEGQAEKSQKEARQAENEAKEAAQAQRIADARARRAAGRP